MEEKKQIDLINHIGYLLLKHGAEIYRVEESLTRMFLSLGYSDVEVFAIPTYFNISIQLHDGSWYSTVKRSRNNHIHLDHLFCLNNLVRKICDHTITFEQASEEVKQYEEEDLNLNLVLLGYILSAGTFAVFFGGGWNDLIIASIIGFILFYVILYLEKLNIHNIVRTIISSSILALISIIATRFGFITTPQHVITGSIMLLVPGIAITNSLRDIISGDYISGLSRMTEAILLAASIAIGVGCTMMMIGG